MPGANSTGYLVALVKVYSFQSQADDGKNYVIENCHFVETSCYLGEIVLT